MDKTATAPPVSGQPAKRGPGRPPITPGKRLTPAERTRRYRQDTITISRAGYESLLDSLADLEEAIREAARRGNPLAKACAGKRRTELLRALAAALSPAGTAKKGRE